MSTPLISDLQDQLLHEWQVASAVHGGLHEGCAEPAEEPLLRAKGLRGRVECGEFLSGGASEFDLRIHSCVQQRPRAETAAGRLAVGLDNAPRRSVVACSRFLNLLAACGAAIPRCGAVIDIWLHTTEIPGQGISGFSCKTTSLQQN